MIYFEWNKRSIIHINILTEESREFNASIMSDQYGQMNDGSNEMILVSVF